MTKFVKVTGDDLAVDLLACMDIAASFAAKVRLCLASNRQALAEAASIIDETADKKVRRLRIMKLRQQIRRESKDEDGNYLTVEKDKASKEWVLVEKKAKPKNESNDSDVDEELEHVLEIARLDAAFAADVLNRIEAIVKQNGKAKKRA